MKNFVDHFLVAVVLVAGFGYAAYSLGPKALRARLAGGVAWLLRLAPAAFGLGTLAARMAARGTSSGGACGGCDNCGSAATDKPTAAAGEPSAGMPSEVRIPLSTIGKRR